MNTISSLRASWLPASTTLNKRAHAFPWSEKPCQQPGAGVIASFPVNAKAAREWRRLRLQVVLDEATLFNVRSILTISVRGLGKCCWNIDRRTEKRGISDTMAGSPIPQMHRHHLPCTEVWALTRRRFRRNYYHGRSLERRHHRSVAEINYMNKGGIMKWDWIFFDADRALFTLKLIHRPAADVS